MQKRAKEVNLENICQNCKKGIAASFFTGKYNNKFVPKRLGDRILETFYIKTLERNDRMYVFEGGYYKEKGKDLIKKACVELLDERYHHGHFSETVSYIQGSTYTNPDEIDNGWINLKNGLLNPFTLESRKHSPEVFSTMQLPIDYDPNADCPTWKEKLKEKTDGPTQDILQKMFGYTFMPGQKYQVAFLLHGPKRTMKSTVINVLESVVGKENATSMSLQYLTEDKYAAAYLYGKPLNVCSDLSAMALRDTGKFMLITGGDKITAGKKHEHQVDFHPSTKLIFSCNEIPPTANKNPAFYRRWIILTFNKQTHESDIDTSLSEKFEEELPGILNWALTGLEKLIKDDSFNYWLDPEEVKDLYEKNSDSIQSFIFNKIDSENDEGVMKKRVVYKAYKQYCQDEGLRTENQIKFGKMFIQLTGCGNCQENKIPAYRGVEWREGRQPTLSEY